MDKGLLWISVLELRYLLSICDTSYRLMSRLALASWPYILHILPFPKLDQIWDDWTYVYQRSLSLIPDSLHENIYGTFLLRYDKLATSSETEQNHSAYTFCLIQFYGCFSGLPIQLDLFCFGPDYHRILYLGKFTPTYFGTLL